MIFVEKLKENNDFNLPEEFLDILPEECEDCGSPLWIGEALTGLSCSNPRCSAKIVKRIEAICTKLGILDFGESRIQGFVEKYGVTNPLAIFELEEGMVINDSASDELSRKIIKQIKDKNEFLLWEYVAIAQIPNIQSNARKIFQGYSSLEEAYDDIKEGGIPFIQEKLGIACEDSDVSVMAVKVYKALMEFEGDLFEGLSCVNIIELGEVTEVNVVCSDQVGDGFSKKSEFYEYCKNEFKDRFKFNFLGSVNTSINYLVWAGADGSPARYTNKVKTVEKYNDKGYNIPIVTAREFIQIMRDSSLGKVE